MAAIAQGRSSYRVSAISANDHGADRTAVIVDGNRGAWFCGSGDGKRVIAGDFVTRVAGVL